MMTTPAEESGRFVDSLQMYEVLKEEFSEQQATLLSKTFTGIMANNLATKEDVRLHRQETRADYKKLDGKIDALEAKLDDKIDTLEARLDDKIDTLEARLDDKIDTLETKLDGKIDTVKVSLEDKITTAVRESEQRLTIRMLNHSMVTTGFIVTAVGLMIRFL